jgi:hypothetical protein
MAGLLLAVADVLPEAERSRFWKECGIAQPSLAAARAMRAGQARDG